jgi:hypothetical protein
MRFPAAVAAEQSWRGWSRRLSRRGQPFTKGDLSGASGPQPHRNFIEVFGEAPLRGGEGEVEGAGEDGSTPTARVRNVRRDWADDYDGLCSAADFYYGVMDILRWLGREWQEKRGADRGGW